MLTLIHIYINLNIIGSGMKTCRTNRSIADKIRYSSIEIHNSITKLSQGIGVTFNLLHFYRVKGFEDVL